MWLGTKMKLKMKILKKEVPVLDLEKIKQSEQKKEYNVAKKTTKLILSDMLVPLSCIGRILASFLIGIMSGVIFASINYAGYKKILKPLSEKFKNFFDYMYDIEPFSELMIFLGCVGGLIAGILFVGFFLVKLSIIPLIITNLLGLGLLLKHYVFKRIDDAREVLIEEKNKEVMNDT